MTLHLKQKHTEDHHLGVTKQIKAKKCQLERIRRQRINDKLEKLKIIVMKHLGNDVGFYPPMEKADILELAIRCLEGKENEQYESENKENDKSSPRKPLAKLNETVQSSNIRRKIEVTPTREPRVPSPTETDETTCDTAIGQSRADIKPLLDHPISSFRNSFKKRNDKTLQIKPYQQCLKSTQMISSPLQTIWRPWTL